MFMLCVIWNTSVLVEHMPALQEGSAVWWMTLESHISGSQGEVFSYLQSIQTNS
jgi:hypothetical protein